MTPSEITASKKEVHRESCKRADLWTKMVARTTGLQWLAILKNKAQVSENEIQTITKGFRYLCTLKDLIRLFQGGEFPCIGLTYCLHRWFPTSILGNLNFLGETHPCERPRATTQMSPKCHAVEDWNQRRSAETQSSDPPKKTWHREMEGFINSACGFHPFFLVALWCFLDVAFSLKTNIRSKSTQFRTCPQVR